MTMDYIDSNDISYFSSYQLVIIFKLYAPLSYAIKIMEDMGELQKKIIIIIIIIICTKFINHSLFNNKVFILKNIEKITI